MGKIERIAIWGVLALIVALAIAILSPVFVSARAAAEIGKRQDRLKNIGIALARYEEKYDDTLPDKGHWAGSLIPFLNDPRVIAGCEDVPANPPRPCGLTFREEFSGKKFDSIEDPDEWVVLEDAPPNHYVRFKLNLLGEVKRVIDQK